MNPSGNEHEKGSGIARRAFLARAAGIAAGFTIVRPGAVRGSEANEALKIGIIGCGGRGNFVLERFKEAKVNFKLVGLHDPFPNNAEVIRAAHAEPTARIYGGLDGYKELIGSGIDAVVITSPPYCHPEQAMAAVDAGKHVWCAKPVAVDTFGAKSFIVMGR